MSCPKGVPLFIFKTKKGRKEERKEKRGKLNHKQLSEEQSQQGVPLDTCTQNYLTLVSKRNASNH